MPLTQLDEHRALILIDLQKGIVARAAAHGGQEVVDRAAQLARAFRQSGQTVVLVHVTAKAPGRTDAAMNPGALPPDWADLVAELDRQPDDYIVTKKCFGAFLGTQLDGYLRSRGVTQVFVGGISTSVGVESTARSAYDLGYNVVLVSDAMMDSNPEAHQFTVEKIFPRMAEVDTTENVLALLTGAAAR